MLASSPTISASGTDHTRGTNAKISRPNPGPTEWINVSVVYGPPDVEKKRTKTRPSVPIPRGSFCLIVTPNVSGKQGTQETLSDSPAKSHKSQRLCFVLSLHGLCILVVTGPLRNIVSVMILCDLRVQIDRCG